jgi:hypothetical protein
MCDFLQFNEDEFDKMTDGEKERFKNTTINELANRYISVHNYLSICPNNDIIETELFKHVENYLIAYMDKVNIFTLIVDGHGRLIKSEEVAPLPLILHDMKIRIAEKLSKFIDSDSHLIEKDIEEFFSKINKKYKPKINRHLTFIRGVIGKL